MPAIYRSNAPEYFRYIATIYNKDEILANPNLCHLIEDPYLKDDMELALSYNAAENGGYEEKKEFVQFFLANGPELDAGTIMYYRNIILNDSEQSFIANTEFANIETVDLARREIYGKNTSDNCFLNPCNYLGPFSTSMCKVGDSKNFKNLKNLFSSKIYGEETEDGSISEVFGDICSNLFFKLIPNIQANYNTLLQHCSQQYSDFADALKDSKKVKPTDIPCGDPKAVQRADDLAPFVNAQACHKLGDCARLYQHMRRLNLYDPAQNTQGPVKEVGNKSTTGVPQPATVTTDEDTVAPAPIAVEVNGKG